MSYSFENDCDSSDFYHTNDIVLTPTVTIGFNHPCLVVAEIGQNHQGDINIAEKLITSSKECGADVVKFQMCSLEEKFTKSALDREYSSPNSWGRTYGEHKKHLEFTKEQFVRLQQFAQKEDILFTASASDPVSLKFLDSLNPPFIKIGSGDNQNYYVLEEALKSNKPLVISTGMMKMEEVEKLYKHCSGRCKAVLLHCVSSYPTLPSDINLNVIDTYRKKFKGFHVGYSGHEEGIAISLAAVTKGAKVLERHVTLDKSWKGTDHACSLEPSELKALVKGIREIDSCLGSKEKQFLDCEMPCYRKLGKSLVAAETLKAGTILDLVDVKVKVSQPPGLDASKLFDILGKRINKNIEIDEPITLCDIL